MPTRKWGGEVFVSGPGTSASRTSIAVLNDGTYVIVFGRNTDVFAQRYAPDGVSLGGPIIVANFTDVDPSVAATADGGFVVSWTRSFVGSDTDPRAQRYTAAGLANGATINITSDLGDLDGETYVTTRNGGGFAVVYVDATAGGDPGDVRLKAFDSAGAELFSTLVNDGKTSKQYGPVVAQLGAGSYVVAWASDLGGTSDYRFRIVSATGVVTGGDRVLADPVPFNDPFKSLAITPLAFGGFVATWWQNPVGFPDASGTEVRARVFSGTGAALTDSFTVNSTMSGEQADPDVVPLANGGFMVAWFDKDTGTIRAQAYTSGGVAYGGETIVSSSMVGSSTLGGPHQIDAGLLADGRVVIAWENRAGTGDVRMQIIDPREGQVNGTSSVDTLYGHDFVNDEISGLAGGDAINGMGGDDAIYAGDGADLAFGGRGDDAIFGGNGSDIANGGEGDDVLLGEENDDLLFGEAGNDQLVGGSGSDTANGGLGADGLLGGDGNDVLVGEVGNDALYGGAGADTMLGGSDDDTLVGEAGDDQILGDAGVDTALGGSGADQMYGGGGNDVLNGGADGDVIRGEDGDDVLVGEDGGDDLQGGIGNDALFGDAGGDALSGGDGSDVLIGGAGGDLLNGGAGADVFWFKLANDGVDVIQDFASGVDRIWLTSAAFNLPLGGLNPANFVAAASPTPTAAAPTLLYNLATGALSFDPDGTGPQGALVLAMMSGPLSASDFLIVG